MNTVTSIFSRKPNDRAEAIQTVCDALAGMNEDRVITAQSRALRWLARGFGPGRAAEFAIAWARCAIDPSDPTPPKVA